MTVIYNKSGPDYIGSSQAKPVSILLYIITIIQSTKRYQLAKKNQSSMMACHSARMQVSNINADRRYLKLA